MEQTASLKSLQRAFTLIMAVLLFVFSLAFSAYQNSGKSRFDEGGEHLVALTSFHGVAGLPSAPDTLSKTILLYSVIPLIWILMLLQASRKVRKQLVSPVRFFLLKINFIFVSTQAP